MFDRSPLLRRRRGDGVLGVRLRLLLAVVHQGELTLGSSRLAQEATQASAARRYLVPARRAPIRRTLW
jgi:hypothetical protein